MSAFRERVLRLTITTLKFLCEQQIDYERRVIPFTACSVEEIILKYAR